MDRRVELYAYVFLCPSCLTSQVQGTSSGQGSTATLADSTAATHGCWPQVPTKPTCRAWLPAKALQVPVFLFFCFWLFFSLSNLSIVFWVFLGGVPSQVVDDLGWLGLWLGTSVLSLVDRLTLRRSFEESVLKSSATVWQANFLTWSC